MNIILKKIYQHNLWHTLLLLYVTVLPFGTALINITYALIILVWVIELINKKISFTKKDVFLILIFSGYYLLSVISYIYSENYENAINKIALQSYLFVFPLILITKKKILTISLFSKLIQFFSMSLLFFGLLSITNQLIKYSTSSDVFYSFFIENNLSTSVIDNYFLGISLAISFSIIASSYIKFFRSSWFSDWYLKLFYGINGLLFLFLILLNSRSLIFLTVSFLTIIILLSEIRLKKRKAIILIPLLFFILLFNFQFNKGFREKVKEAINYENEYSIDKKWGGTSMRYLIWDCTFKVIQENPLIGVGVGDQQDELTLCYKIYMLDELLQNKTIAFNAHNIFMQILLSTGILGLILFVFSLIYPFIVSLKRNLIYVCFILLFITAGLTESYLERNISLAFFSFFNVICFLNPTND